MPSILRPPALTPNIAVISRLHKVPGVSHSPRPVMLELDITVIVVFPNVDLLALCGQTQVDYVQAQFSSVWPPARPTTIEVKIKSSAIHLLPVAVVWRQLAKH